MLFIIEEVCVLLDAMLTWGMLFLENDMQGRNRVVTNNGSLSNDKNQSKWGLDLIHTDLMEI